MRRTIITTVAVASLTALAGCESAPLAGETPSGETLNISYYDGGNNLDDLVVMDGEMHYGSAVYQRDDPLGDIGFRFNSGERVLAGCSREGENIVGDPMCLEYTVFLSQFDPIPEDTVFARPQLF